MGLRTALGLKKRKTSIVPPNEDSHVIFTKAQVDSFNAEEPLRKLYKESILASQDGAIDSSIKEMRYFILAQLAQIAVRKFPDLDFAECGCFRGHSTQELARIMRSGGSTALLHVFDSFEGLSEFNSNDETGLIAPAARDGIRKNFKSSFDEVRRRLAEFSFIKFYQGWIPEKFVEVSDKKFGFVSVDVDLYQPTKDSVEFFYPRLVSGGLMYFDDYGTNYFPGARKAIDEVLKDNPPRYFFRMPFASAILIK